MLGSNLFNFFVLQGGKYTEIIQLSAHVAEKWKLTPLDPAYSWRTMSATFTTWSCCTPNFETTSGQLWRKATHLIVGKEPHLVVEVHHCVLSMSRKLKYGVGKWAGALFLWNTVLHFFEFGFKLQTFLDLYCNLPYMSIWLLYVLPILIYDSFRTPTATWPLAGLNHGSASRKYSTSTNDTYCWIWGPASRPYELHGHYQVIQLYSTSSER